MNFEKTLHNCSLHGCELPKESVPFKAYLLSILAKRGLPVPEGYIIDQNLANDPRIIPFLRNKYPGKTWILRGLDDDVDPNHIGKSTTLILNDPEELPGIMDKVIRDKCKYERQKYLHLLKVYEDDLGKKILDENNEVRNVSDLALLQILHNTEQSGAILKCGDRMIKVVSGQGLHIPSTTKATELSVIYLDENGDIEKIKERGISIKKAEEIVATAKEAFTFKVATGYKKDYEWHCECCFNLYDDNKPLDLGIVQIKAIRTPVTDPDINNRTKFREIFRLSTDEMPLHGQIKVIKSRKEWDSLEINANHILVANPWDIDFYKLTNGELPVSVLISEGSVGQHIIDQLRSLNMFVAKPHIGKFKYLETMDGVNVSLGICDRTNSITVEEIASFKLREKDAIDRFISLHHCGGIHPDRPDGRLTINGIDLEPAMKKPERFQGLSNKDFIDFFRTTSRFLIFANSNPDKPGVIRFSTGDHVKMIISGDYGLRGWTNGENLCLFGSLYGGEDEDRIYENSPEAVLTNINSYLLTLKHLAPDFLKNIDFDPGISDSVVLAENMMKNPIFEQDEIYPILGFILNKEETKKTIVPWTLRKKLDFSKLDKENIDVQEVNFNDNFIKLYGYKKDGYILYSLLPKDRESVSEIVGLIEMISAL
jgi:hypothetical protein